MNDAPLGGMDWKGLTYSADRMREDEAVARQLGQQCLVVAAARADRRGRRLHRGRRVPVVAARAVQDDTAVVPAHRGYGLGLWVKAEMLRRLRAAARDVDVVTRNGETTSTCGGSTSGSASGRTRRPASGRPGWTTSPPGWRPDRPLWSVDGGSR